MNKCEAHYQSKMKEIQAEHDESLGHIEDLQFQINKLEQERNNIGNQFNEVINSLKRDHEKQCKEFQNEIDVLNDRG